MFRIKSLSVRNHYKFGNLDFNFCNFDQDTLNYYTVLIGPNGTGKSLILEIIINLFKLISNRQLELFDDYSSGFKIEFYYNSKLFFYSNLDGLTSTNINSKDDLPKKIIANTFSANDRFPFIDKRRIMGELEYFEKAYEYQGLRTIYNAIYKGSNLKKLFYSIIGISQRIEKLKNLQILFENIGFEQMITFNLKPGKGLKIKHGHQKIYDFLSDENSFKDYFDNIILRKYSSYSRNNNRYNYLRTFIDDKDIVNKASVFLQRLLYKNDFSIKNKTNIKYLLDFSDLESFEEIREFAISIELLIELELIDIAEISFIKNQHELGIYSMSSGEFNILSSIINIASKIDDYSIILIDEPEISLHPEWQMKYLTILKKAFENFIGIHFIISTHSHFILSNLFSTNSKILVLNYDSDYVSINYFEDSTYAKSAEEILLHVFKTPTTRNFYVNDLVGNILDKMANPETPNNIIIEDIQKLKSLNLESLNDSDPLKDIVVKLISKLNEN